MTNVTEVRRQILVHRAIADVGSAWEYFGKIADTRGFKDLAAGTIDELGRAGFQGALRKPVGRLADVGRLVAAYRKLDPDFDRPPEPEGAMPARAAGAPPRVEVIEAPGPVGEARLVARRIRELTAGGVPPNDIVVTARDVEASADVFAEVFDEFAIPVTGFPAPPLGRAPAVAFLLRAWRVSAGGFAFADVAAVLRSSFFRPPGVDSDQPAKTEALLRKVGGPDGKESFVRAVDRCADAEDEPLSDEGPDESSRRRTRSLARTCRPFVQSYFALWDDIPSKAKPAAWVERLRRFARECGVEPATHPGDAAALETLWVGLDTWVESLPAGKTVSVGTFAAGLAVVADAARGPVPPPPSPAVRVLAAEDARYAAYEHLFLTGLGEGSFPDFSPPDSLLTDADRIELRAAGLDLPDPAARRRAEQSLFDDLVGRPRKLLVFSYPAVDAKGQEQLPSSFLADWRETHEPAAVTKQKMLIQQYAKGELYSGAEQRVRYADALANGNDEPTVSTVAAPVAATIRRARQVAAARFGDKKFNRFDGNLDAAFLTANRDIVGHDFDPKHVFSPTALEAYVACPFKFWLDHVLGVEPLDDPPDAVEHTRRGLAIHRALRQYHEAGTDCDDADTVTSGVRAQFDAAVEEYRKRSGGPVTVALWALEALRLRRTAARYHGQWHSFRSKESKTGTVPVPKLFEASFGLSPDKDKPARPPLVLTVGNVEVRICGTVDRIDTAQLPDGLGVWVIDYKSGRATSYSGTAIARLEKLQLPLYALAAERVLFPGQSAKPLGLAYWLVTDTGPKSVTPKKMEWARFRDQLEWWVAAVVARLRGGSFPLAPRSDDCTATCRHGPVCRITQHRRGGKSFDLTPPATVGEADG